MNRRLAWTVLLLVMACGIKAPPRPPEPERPAAPDGGAAAATGCGDVDGGCAQ